MYESTSSPVIANSLLGIKLVTEFSFISWIAKDNVQFQIRMSEFTVKSIPYFRKKDSIYFFQKLTNKSSTYGHHPVSNNLLQICVFLFEY
jgi:hypothetical protein